MYFCMCARGELDHGIFRVPSSLLMPPLERARKALAPHLSRGAADAVGVALYGGDNSTVVGPEEATSWGNLRGTKLALVLLQSVRARPGAPAGTISGGHCLG